MVGKKKDKVRGNEGGERGGQKRDTVYFWEREKERKGRRREYKNAKGKEGHTRNSRYIGTKVNIL